MRQSKVNGINVNNFSAGKTDAAREQPWRKLHYTTMHFCFAAKRRWAGRRDRGPPTFVVREGKGRAMTPATIS